MLKICNSLNELSFSALMSVYEESNQLNASELYGGMDKNAALIQVEQDFYAYLQECFFATKGAWYAVWVDNGSYISALRMEPFEDGVLLEALETAPHCRRKGYGEKLVKAALKLVEGKVYSHVRPDNIPSYQLHLACGFVKVSDSCTYVDGTKSDRCATLLYVKT